MTTRRKAEEDMAREESSHKLDELLHRKVKPLGLSLLYAPEYCHPSVDIIFIHGLRGDPIRTWCYRRELKNYWLHEWLPLHPEFSKARIWTFGYDSDWFSFGPGNELDITAFGDFLLFSARLAANDTPESMPVGKVSYTAEISLRRLGQGNL